MHQNGARIIGIKMFIVNEMPKIGSFVMIWGDPDNLFSESFKYIDEVLHIWGMSPDVGDGNVYETWIDDYWEVSSIMNDEDTKFIVK